jgi:hypothetical protein
LEYVGNAFGTEKGRAVCHLKMQVRPVGIPAVSQQCQNLAGMYPLADLDAKAAGLEVGILRETPVPQIEDDIVPGDIVQRGHCGHFRRDIERNAVFDIGDDGIGDGKNLLTEAVITGVMPILPSLQATQLLVEFLDFLRNNSSRLPIR